MANPTIDDGGITTTTLGEDDFMLGGGGGFNFTDPDHDAHSATWTSLSGNHLGNFSVSTPDSGIFDGTGSVSWFWSAPNSVVQYLADGESRVMVYELTIFSSNGESVTQNVTVTVTGSND